MNIYFSPLAMFMVGSFILLTIFFIFKLLDENFKQQLEIFDIQYRRSFEVSEAKAKSKSYIKKLKRVVKSHSEYIKSLRMVSDAKTFDQMESDGLVALLRSAIHDIGQSLIIFDSFKKHNTLTLHRFFVSDLLFRIKTLRQIQAYSVADIVKFRQFYDKMILNDTSITDAVAEDLWASIYKFSLDYDNWIKSPVKVNPAPLLVLEKEWEGNQIHAHYYKKLKEFAPAMPEKALRDFSALIVTSLHLLPNGVANAIKDKAGFDLLEKCGHLFMSFQGDRNEFYIIHLPVKAIVSIDRNKSVASTKAIGKYLMVDDKRGR